MNTELDGWLSGASFGEGTKSTAKLAKSHGILEPSPICLPACSWRKPWPLPFGLSVVQFDPSLPSWATWPTKCIETLLSYSDRHHRGSLEDTTEVR